VIATRQRRNPNPSGRVWTLDQEQLVSIAESRLTRTLTDAECRRYLEADSCAEAGAS